MLVKYKLDLCYFGKYFNGFQYQPLKRTVMGDVLFALKRLYGEDISALGAGRTDSGVHAAGQVIHYECSKVFPTENIVLALNSFLKDDLNILSASLVDRSFHSVRSAASREYVYSFSDQSIPLGLNEYITYCSFSVPFVRIQSLCLQFVGIYNFKAFTNTGSSQNCFNREIFTCDLSPNNFKDVLTGKSIKVYSFRIIGKSFLYRMVRNIMGSLFELMKDNIQESDILNALQTGNKTFSYMAAPAKGLCLMKVNY